MKRFLETSGLHQQFNNSWKFNPVSTMGKTTGQISKETEDFNNTINQLDLTDRHLQNTPLNDIRIHIILKCM